jgi:hypothetical protein
MLMTKAGMVGVTVADHGIRHRFDRIDVKITCRTVKASGSDFYKRTIVDGHAVAPSIEPASLKFFVHWKRSIQ